MLTAIYGKKQPIGGVYTVVLGAFDGVHIGHESLLQFAATLGNPIAVMTIFGKNEDTVLFTQSERERIFANYSVELLYRVDLTEEVRSLDCATFLKGLLSEIDVACFVCGRDFRFGKGASGDADLVRALTNRPVYSLPLVTDHGQKASSSAIRGWIEDGNIQKANRWLAKHSQFFVEGVVLRGRAVGRTMGFPTANISYPSQKLRIYEGVYAVSVPFEGRIYRGIANLGKIPTFGIDQVTLEVYIDGFSGDLYGKQLQVYFEQLIRPIVKFDSIEALKRQLQQDLEVIR